jgi:hypothetical protein
MADVYEYRRDGWPLCPSCGEDELADLNMRHWPANTTADPLAELTCYACRWVGTVPAACRMGEPTMQPIILRTATGELVREATMPPFKIPPDVVFWGARTFKRGPADQRGRIAYYETFAYALVDVDIAGNAAAQFPTESEA